MPKYILPDLSYEYSSLAPYISEEQLKVHHQKHHQAYVTGANAILDKFENSDISALDLKAVCKELSFQVGGHVLHSLFWKNMAPKSKGGEPEGLFLDQLNADFGSIENFKAAFTKVAMSCEASGWAALVFCSEVKKFLLTQIEKHNVNIMPEHKILMVLDVFEHAYYIDYKNEKAKFVEGFWNIVNWKEIGTRFQEI